MQTTKSFWGSCLGRIVIVMVVSVVVAACAGTVFVAAVTSQLVGNIRTQTPENKTVSRAESGIVFNSPTQSALPSSVQVTHTPVPATAVPLPTSEPTTIPTAEPTLSPTTEPPTETPLRAATLPGVSPSGMTAELENNGFECDTVSQVEEVYFVYLWNCTFEQEGGVVSVNIQSRSLGTVDYISIDVVQYGEPSDEAAASFLGFMATVPYENAQPEEARAWVEQTLPTLSGEPGDIQEREFGGVVFQLYGPPTARFLEIGSID